jgi:predicted dinucleotide-binding enzyme
MKIGIIGVGHIGKTLALKLAQVGHEVDVANSSGPENIGQNVLSTGARAVAIQHAMEGKDVIILSIPLNRIPDITNLLSAVSDSTTIIDTSNYYPARDSKINSIEAGQVESLWVTEQLGRPVAKAWNAIGSDSLIKNGKPAGSEGRIAIPIASDRDVDKTIAIQLINDTGFDAYYTGSLADSWRQQPGAPIYCTDLTIDEMETLVNTAEKERLPVRRDIAVSAIMERMSSPTTNPDAEFGLRLSRALYI